MNNIATETNETAEARIFGISRNVFFLSLTSFLQDISGEMIFTIMPFFLANVLGVGTAIIGLIEGISESTPTFLNFIGGWLSDRLQQRKSLTVLGYALSTAAKPFMYFASSWPIALGVRFVDRVAKGVRTSPRDALIADCCSVEDRGKNFGFHRALDTLGAFVGLAVAAAIVFFLQRGDIKLELATYQTLVLVGIVPGVLGVLCLLFFVHEVHSRQASSVAGEAATRTPLRKVLLQPQFLTFLVIMLVFTLGNSSDAFLLLRAQNVGHSVLGVILLLVLFNLVYALVSTPAGILSDKIGRKRVIAMGWSLYALVYLGFGLAGNVWEILLLYAVYGVYYGLTQGVAKALVADFVPAEGRGSAYGIYNAGVGLMAFPASIIAGFLWQTISPSATFFFGAILAALATAALVVLVRR